MKSKYNTKQREKILKYLKENRDSNITADEILKYFKTAGDNIGKSTVYRFLNDLTSQNIIRKYTIEGQNCSYYQFIEGKNCEEHYHLKCEKCNKIIHLDCNEFNRIQKHIYKEHSFKLDSIKTVLYGICKDCEYQKRISLERNISKNE